VFYFEYKIKKLFFMVTISNKLIIASHTLPYGWKITEGEQDHSFNSFKRTLSKTSFSSDFFAFDVNENPFPHLYSDYYSGNEIQEVNLNDILEKSAPFTLLTSHINHPARFYDPAFADVRYIGWPGKSKEVGIRGSYPDFSTELQNQLERQYEGVQCVPIFLKPKEAKNHLEGYCKNRLWNIIHYSLWRNVIDLSWEHEIYDDYTRVNKQFAAKIYETYRAGDTGIQQLKYVVLIIGYHLLLVPKLLKEMDENIFICTFIPHIWPTSELFRCLPRNFQN
jgi:trehalose-6-phosphate synthase